MVTQSYNDNSEQIIYLTSSDAKPSGCDNGSAVVEVDTAKKFLYDAENDEWYQAGYVEVTM